MAAAAGLLEAAVGSLGTYPGSRGSSGGTPLRGGSPLRSSRSVRSLCPTLTDDGPSGTGVVGECIAGVGGTGNVVGVFFPGPAWVVEDVIAPDGCASSVLLTSLG